MEKELFFLNTNIIVYTFDKSSPAKQERAQELLVKAIDGEGVISYQVVQEFLNVATSKFTNSFIIYRAESIFEQF